MSEFFHEPSAQFVKDFIKRLPTTDTGKLFQLYDWQEQAVGEFYGTLIKDEDTGEVIRKYQNLYLEIPKKNGKSELAGALGLFHLVADGERNAEVYVCAADKDNASIVFDDSVFMAENSPLLSPMVAKGELKIKPSTRVIEYRKRKVRPDGTSYWQKIGYMKVLSAEAYSKHGYKPSCVIFDELHAQPNRALYDVMTFGSGSSRKQPVWIVLTTAGDDPDRNSIGWEVHEQAVNIRDARMLRKILKDGGDPRSIFQLRHVEDADLPAAQEALLALDLPQWLPILYGLTAMYGDDPDDLAEIDIYNEDLWYQCNPSLGHHLKIRTLRAEAKSAKTNEAAEKLFRWLRLNQWIAVKAVSWIPLPLYDKLQYGPSKKADRETFMETLRGLTCYGGVDLSSTTDLTAFVLFFPAQRGLDKAVWLSHIWRSSKDLETAEKQDRAPYRDWSRAGFIKICPGDTIDYADVEETISQAKSMYDLKVVGFDPYLSRTITQRLQPIVDIIEVPQDMKNMSPAMKEIEMGVLNHNILHVHNTCFRWCFGNVRCAVDGNENKKPMKNRSPGRIDPAVALIIAVATWMIFRNQTPDLAQAMERADGFSL